ncbi:magnesium-translocating P-type ATPase [Spiroplasma endosymbiont of Notiophilus biguttatus]|uniref:magnesium-translocating P-type ATPase n=1 Tax=Spiroplasma endosymbiont of Notiophilus biguttatus TaxID=3066285 RepID=UPI00313AEF96
MKIFLNKIYFKLQFSFKKPLVYTNGDYIKQIAQFNQKQLLKNLDLHNFGLKTDQIEIRRKKYGINTLKNTKFNWILEFLKAYFGPFNIILSIITIYNLFSYFTTNDTSIYSLVAAIIVGTMILLSGTLIYIQSIRAFFITKHLTILVKNTATVIRNININQITKENSIKIIKQAQEINVNELLPGDLIYLSAGDLIPADLKILLSNDLFINQSSLTGESLPAEKHAINDPTYQNLFDLQNICFMGTSVVSGSAIAIVIATATNTYFATIADTINKQRPLSSFSKGIKRVTLMLICFMLVMVPIVLIINGLLKSDWPAAFIFSISVAVGLTPEMLPMIVTSNLARGASKMSKQKVVVKQLAAIQNLGAIDILCTDKTGTLTNDNIEVVNHITLDNKTNNDLIKFIYLNSYFQTGIKNPMDNSIIEFGEKNKLKNISDYYQKIDEIPFDFNRRKLTIVLQDKLNNKKLICKGAIEEVINTCNRIVYQDKVIPLNSDLMKMVNKKITKLNEQGLRVLGVSYEDTNLTNNKYNETNEKNLIFLGFVTFLDTPKPTATKMIKLLKTHGVDLKILTGDNELVTRAICNRVNLEIKGLISGEQLTGLTKYELKRVVENNNIFVKLNPLQKAKIIQTLKSNDHVVGFMGDGINDALVLRNADVGISVDNATDIAKEASDIILLEKSLLVLEKGIIEGRRIFGNILKYIKITIASNFGNVFSVLVASAWFAFAPMSPVQLLFQNLLYDISQFTIAFDRVDPSFLLKPQRWNPKGMLPFAFINGPISSIFDISTFAILGFGFGVFANPSAENINMFNSGWFIEGLLTQTLIVQMFRTEKIPFIQSRGTWPVNIMAIAICTIGLSLPYTYIGHQMNMVGPPPTYIPIVLGIIMTYCVLSQLIKMGYIKTFKKWL